MSVTPPNNSTFRQNIGHSCHPSAGAGAAGKGAQPTGNRFDAASLMDRAQNPEVVAPGKGAIPVEPFGPSGMPRPASLIPEQPRR